MDDAERSTQAYPRDSYHRMEPVIGKNIYRETPRPCMTGFIQGGVSVNTTFTDNDHCRIVFIPKPAVTGGSTTLLQKNAQASAKYTFKSSYDEQPVAEKKH